MAPGQCGPKCSVGRGPINMTEETFAYYLSDESFDDALSEYRLLLVDFTADWCSPCKAMEPTIERVAVDFVGKMRVAKMDLDDSPEVTSRYRVLGIPALILFRDSEPVLRLHGVKSYAQIVEGLAPFVEK